MLSPIKASQRPHYSDPDRGNRNSKKFKNGKSDAHDLDISSRTSFTEYSVTKRLSRAPVGAVGHGSHVLNLSTKRRPRRTGGE